MRQLASLGVLAVLLVLVGPAQAQTVIWFSGAEDGIPPSAINGFTCCQPACGQISVNTSTKTTGYGAYQIDASGGTFSQCVNQPIGGSLTTMYARFQYRHPGATPSSAVAYAFRASGSHPHLCLFLTAAGKLAWGNASCTVAVATGPTTIADDTFYLVEFKAVLDASVGGMELKVNGNVEFTSFGSNTGTSTFNGFGMGPGDPGSISATGFYDDVMVCSGSYCPAGRTVARQGTSGSPTYTAWTKTGTCSGGNIEDCWSATPFSTAAAATSIIASDAQTMVVHDFATTQTGHGTETIDATSTINACTTAMVAKTAVSSAASIRRRISGSDTDTAKTLTTADAYYDDGIWTTTATILGTSTNEIGAVHGAGVNLDTVEDMWLMCDFGPATAPIRHRVTQ